MTIFFAGCKSKEIRDEERLWKLLGFETPPPHEENEEAVLNLFYKFPPSVFVKDTVALYELKEDYYAVMDSVVWKSINAFGSKHRKLGFVFYGHKEGDGADLILIYPLEYRTIHTEEDAIFYYNGFQFNYEGDFIDEMFVVKDSITIWNIDSKLREYLVESDHLGVYSYLLEDGELIPNPLYSESFE